MFRSQLLNAMFGPQTRQHQGQTSIYRYHVQIPTSQRHGRTQNLSTPRSDLNLPTPCSDPNFSTPWSEAKLVNTKVRPQFTNTMFRPQFLNAMVGPQLNIMVGSQLNLFQNPPNSQPISSGHDVIHTPAHFLSGVYYDYGDCHILCVRA